MHVRGVAARSAMSMGVMVVRLPLVSPHHLRLVRAPFIARMGLAQMRVHSEDGGRGDRAGRDLSATRTGGGLIARRHRLPVFKVAATAASVGVERHVLLLSERGLMRDPR